MFGSWMSGLNKNLRSLSFLGAAATVWSLWLNRNDIVFEKKKILLSFAGYLYYYPLATHVGCATEGRPTNYLDGGYAMFGASGQGIFYPGSWMAI